MLRNLFRSGHAYGDIQSILTQVMPKGACLDLPAGTGVNWQGIEAAGFRPWAADLFPKTSAPPGSPRVKVDFTADLPFADESFAAILCSEGIEHHPAQSGLIAEFARLIQPGGHLLITTPNVLNLRARFSHMLTGHSPANRGPLCEVSQIWPSSDGKGKFIGHAHLIDYFELRFILVTNGFRIRAVDTARYSRSSLVLAPLLWLPAWIATAMFLRKRLKKETKLRAELLQGVMSPPLALGKKMIVLAERLPHAGASQYAGKTAASSFSQAAS